MKRTTQVAADQDHLRLPVRERRSEVRRRHHERGIRHRRFWEHATG